MLLDVRDDGRGEQVAHGEPALEEEPDLRRRHVVLDELRDEVDVVPPAREVLDRLVDVRARALDDERAVAPEDVLELRARRRVPSASGGE